MWRWDRIGGWSLAVAVALYIVFELLYIVISTIVNIVVRGG